MDIYRDLDVFGRGALLIEPNWNQEPRQGTEGDQELSTSGEAQSVLEGSSRRAWTSEFRKEFGTAQEQFEFFDFARSRMGRVRPFWSPSWSSDFKLLSDVGMGERVLRVLRCRFDWIFEADRYGIYIETPTDRHIYAIESFETDLDNQEDRIILRSAVGANIKASSVFRVSLVRRVRFATDRFEMSMDTTLVGSLNYSLVEVFGESEYMREEEVEDLSVGYDYKNSFSAQLMLSGDWWDPTSDMSGTGGTGASFRTNRSLALMQVQVDALTSVIGLRPKDLPYTQWNANGRPLAHGWPPFAYRTRPVDSDGKLAGAWDAWTFVQYTTHKDFVHGMPLIRLASSRRQRVQIAVVHPAVVPNVDIIYSTRQYEPGQTSALNSVTGQPLDHVDYLYFLEFSALTINASGSFETFTDTRLPLRVLVLGDKTSDGSVRANDPSYYAGQPVEWNNGLDCRGVIAQWPWKVLEAYENERNARVAVVNSSFSGGVVAPIWFSIRNAALLAQKSDEVDHFDNLTNPRALPADFSPHVVLFAFGSEDQLWQAYYNPLFNPANTVTDMTAVLAAIIAKWTTASVAVLPFPRLDNTLPANPFTGGSVNVYSSISTAATSLGLTVLTPSTSTVNPGATDLLNAEEHALVATTVYGTIKALADFQLKLGSTGQFDSRFASRTGLLANFV